VSIDWLTVAAQVMNFLILVWLLKRFLYLRVLDAMDRREQTIAARLAEARARTGEAEREAESLRRKSRELDEQRESMLATASAEADQLRSQRQDALRGEIETTRRTWLQQVEREREAFLRALRDQAATRFLALARRALGELANADLETQMVETFLGRLHGDERGAVEEIAASCRQVGQPLLVASGFELPPELKRRVTRAIHDDLGDDLEIAYQTSADVSCGLERSGGGRSVLWSLEGYLDSLAAQLSAAREQNGVASGRLDQRASLSHA
jgi:F-type H+-transporting ATPase subunit b